jgi:SanA protein
MSLNRRHWRVLVVLVLLVSGFVALSSYLCVRGSVGRTYSDLNAVPHRRVGLVLGCTKQLSNGNYNPFFSARVETAAKLFQSGKIDYILVSGDNNRDSYNEPLDMRDSLVAEHIPPNHIYMDYAGLRTLDSILRAKLVFGLHDVTVISQHFHNQRAIYIAQHSGIDAIGFDAPDIGFRDKSVTMVREQFARAKMILDIAFGKQPRFLGPVIRIGIDPPELPANGGRR